MLRDETELRVAVDARSLNRTHLRGMGSMYVRSSTEELDGVRSSGCCSPTAPTCLCISRELMHSRRTCAGGEVIDFTGGSKSHCLEGRASGVRKSCTARTMRCPGGSLYRPW